MKSYMPKMTKLPSCCALYWGVALLLVLAGCRHSGSSALEIVPELNSKSAFGVNLGYYPPNWTEKKQASEARKYGCNTLRSGLFHRVLEKWGYAQKAETLRYCKQLGFEDLVGILGFPAPEACDTFAFCADSLPLTMFKGLYQPIWKDEGGKKQINEENTYALYVWKAANHFKGLIRIYEVWNEPDAGWGGAEKGASGNWWDTAPPPCQTGLKAPVFHYVRLLRITYEVVKSVDSNALVAVGGLGWPSYLDAVCRYTDQPVNGLKNNSEYPLTGGAYFDCMSFHAYPHLYALEKPDSLTAEKKWQRHSDAAIEGLWQRKKDLEDVLFSHGFDGVKFPQKRWICSEFNLPRASHQDRFGSEPAQINFVLKAMVSANWNGLHQMHLYSFADETANPGIDPEFAYMGLFSAPDTGIGSEIKPNLLAFCTRRLTNQLSGFIFDPILTRRYTSESVAGGAFRNASGDTKVILWLKTVEDLKENQTTHYVLPDEYQPQNLLVYSFDKDSWERLDANTPKLTLKNTPVLINHLRTWQ